MSPEIEKILSVTQDVAFGVTLLPLAVGLFRFRSMTFALKALIGLTIVSFLANVITIHYGNTSVISQFTPRVYTYLEFLLISIFFLGITDRRPFRIIIITMLFLFVGVAIVDFSITGLHRRDDLSIAVESTTLICYSVAALYFIMKDAIYPNILATPQFWIISAVLVYFGGSIFVFVTSNYMANTSYEWAAILWGLQVFLNIFFYSLMAIGLWKAKESQ